MCFDFLLQEKGKWGLLTRVWKLIHKFGMLFVNPKPQKLRINKCLLKHIHMCLKLFFSCDIFIYRSAAFYWKSSSATKNTNTKFTTVQVTFPSAGQLMGGSRKVQFCSFFSGHACFSWKEMLQIFEACYPWTKRDVRLNLFTGQRWPTARRGSGSGWVPYSPGTAATAATSIMGRV